jgi:hypothetical protein
MSEYVNTVKIEFDGVVFEDFDQFSDDSVEKNTQVPLMNKTGFAQKTERYGFSVNVKTPVVEGIDVKSVRNGTCTVEFNSGKRVTYGGVYVLETGENTIDGEAPAGSTVSYGAITKIEE